MLASLPSSPTSVSVSIINTTGYVGQIPTTLMVEPSIGTFKHLSCPCFSFLITHAPSNTRLLFDLGIRKDFATGFPPAVWNRLKQTEWEIRAPKDVAEILGENGVGLESVDALIWSHHHWDHTGDPSKFPGKTKLIVGPGFKEEFLPAWPERDDALIDLKSIEGREMVEVDFEGNESGLKIGPYKAIDYFGDGSFYLLDTPGHTIGHISALARTTGGSGEESTFIFMGGDIVHHPGEFRPSATLPLPENIVPDPRQLPFHAPHSICPGALFTPLHPASSTKNKNPHTTSFFRVAASGAHDQAQAQDTVDTMVQFDGNDNVWVVFAHDQSLMDVLKFFPEPANGWKEAGWRKEGLWRFLTDFTG